MEKEKLRNMILTAAKNVCDDPTIEFHTPDEAKCALVNELNKMISEESKES